MKQRLAIREKISQIKNSNEQFVYFMTFLYAVSTGQIGSVDLIKTGETAGYGLYSRTFSNVFRLGVGWGYGLTKSCEMIAAKIARSNENQFKQFLIKLAQVLRLGEELRSFLKDELSALVHTYSIIYERNLETQKLFLEMFYTLMSTAAIMVSANSLMTMLVGSGDGERIFTLSVVGIIVGMGAFTVIMYVLFPRDPLSVENQNAKKIRVWAYFALVLSAGIGITLFILDILPLTLILIAAALPLFIPSHLAMRLETKLRKLNEWYPPFIRHFGQIYGTIGSMGQTMDSVLRSDFGPLVPYAKAFKNRIKYGINPVFAFELFSKETGSAIISAGNIIIAKSISKGADMNEVGNKVAEVTTKINELRGKRQQTSKTFETVIIVLHVLTMAVFGLMNKLSAIFYELLSATSVSSSSIKLTPIDPAFMESILPAVIVSTSVINAFGIKISQGGIYQTIWYHIALLIILGAGTIYVMSNFLSQFLESNIIDFL